MIASFLLSSPWRTACMALGVMLASLYGWHSLKVAWMERDIAQLEQNYATAKNNAETLERSIEQRNAEVTRLQRKYEKAAEKAAQEASSVLEKGAEERAKIDSQDTSANEINKWLDSHFSR